jgi:Type six secretion immunity 3 domain
MQRSVWLAALLCAFLPAYDGRSEEQPSSWAERERITLVHPSGLEIELPADVYEIEISAKGWHIRPQEAARLRSPFDIRIEVAAPARPDGAWPQSRLLHGRTVHYRIDSEEAGSGGILYVLHAWAEGRGDVHLMLEQTVQVEPPAAPDFADSWAILALARNR